MSHTKAVIGPNNKTIEPPADTTNTAQSDVMNNLKDMAQSIEAGASDPNSGLVAGKGLTPTETAAASKLMNSMNQAMTQQENQVFQNAEAEISKLPPEQQAEARKSLQNMEQLLGGVLGGAGGPGKGNS